MPYPLNLILKGRKCLVVGGGAIALDKIRALRKAGARVTVVSPEFKGALRRLKIRRIRRKFRAADLKGNFLVIAATDDTALNTRISGLCRKRGILVNVVDVPELCTFFTVSVVRRGPLTVAISTEGKAPGLSKSLRREFERLYPAGIRRLLDTVARTRARLRRNGAAMKTLRRVSSPNVVTAWRQKGIRGARAAIRRNIRNA